MAKRVKKRDKISSLEALIEEIGSNGNLYLHAAQQWVGHDNWKKLTLEQKLNNVKLVEECYEIREEYLSTFIW